MADQLVTLTFMRKNGTGFEVTKTARFWEETGIFDANIVQYRSTRYVYSGDVSKRFTFTEATEVNLDLLANLIL